MHCALKQPRADLPDQQIPCKGKGNETALFYIKWIFNLHFLFILRRSGTSFSPSAQRVEGKANCREFCMWLMSIWQLPLPMPCALRFALCGRGKTTTSGDSEREGERERESIAAVWLHWLRGWLPFCAWLSLQVLSIPFNAAISFAFRAFCHFALSVSALGNM